VNRSRVESLDQAAALRAAMLDALPPVVLLDPHGVVVATNAAWRRLAAPPRFRLPWAGLGGGYLRALEAVRCRPREDPRPLWNLVETLSAGGEPPSDPVVRLTLGPPGQDLPYAILLTRVAPEGGGGFLVTHIPEPPGVLPPATYAHPLRQARKLEALGQLTGGIAHEINNVLTVILAGVDLVLDEHATDPAARTELLGVRDAARRGAETVRRLLTFSRRHGHGDTRRPVDLGEVIRGMQDLLERVLPAGISLGIHVDDPAPVALAGPGDVEEMLLNLASNARDAMPSGGLLEIRIRRVRLDAGEAEGLGLPEEGDYLGMVVRDTGTGMDIATLERAFEPFFSTRDVDGGSGLGLSLVYGLMKEHGGTVALASLPGAGTSVTLWFPALVTPAASPSPPLSAVGPGRRESILLVEDDEAIRSAAIRILERAGYRVAAAADGAEAIELLGSDGFRVDAVVSDVVMPRAGGTLVHQAAGLLPDPPRFLFMSGYAAHDFRGSRSLPPGVPLLPKPWSAAELLDAVRRVLDDPSPPSGG
jgi:two-component system, cell cycle sensor histidine kinase and response regulator CckA